MESSRSTKSKGFAGLSCIFGGRQHWEVLSYRQGLLPSSLPQSRWRNRQGLADVSITDDLLSMLATFVSAAYVPEGIQIAGIPELRWHLFCKHMVESDKLPPTPCALKQHILGVQIQATVWRQASVAQQKFLDPLKHGFYKDTGLMSPVTTDVLPAPKAIIEIVRCRCRGDCSTARCSCRAKNLSCTDLCLCGTECQNDEASG